MEYMRNELGLTTPRFGIVEDVCEEILPDWPELRDIECKQGERSIEDLISVVVHLDIRSHAGEGKFLMSVKDAVKQYSGEFAVEYIPATPAGVGVSLRYLRIGHRQFWLRYSSSNDWRSNAGDVKIEYLSEEKRVSDKDAMKIHHPLFAVDFVMGAKAMYAIDFNESPGLRGTGIEDVISGKDVYLEIEECLSVSEKRKTQSGV